ncbi:MAG: GLPGLI family protein [Prevotella sp.]|nr:GLPGLI family protein [Prevotella sp.]
MRKILLFALLFLCSYAAVAQVVSDSVKYRFAYDVFYTNTVEGGKKTDVCYLDIGERCSHFYSWQERRKQEIIDSINRTSSVSIELVRKSTEGFHGQSYHVYKGLPDGGRLTHVSGFGFPFIYDEPMPSLDWQMEQRDTTILGYSCQAATAELRGRTWRVWYTEEIPIADGPWKLCGLPGLILKADDTEGYFGFCCIGVENGNKETIQLNRKEMTACDPLELQRNNIKKIINPLSMTSVDIEQFERRYGPVQVPTPVLMEDYEQKR